MWTGAIVSAVIFGALLRLVVVAVVSGFVQLILAAANAPTTAFVLVNGFSLVWAIVWVVLGAADGWEELGRQQVAEEARQRGDRQRLRAQWKAQQGARQRPQRPDRRALRPRREARAEQSRTTSQRQAEPAAAATPSESGTADLFATALAHNAIRVQVPAVLAHATEQAAGAETPHLSLSRSVLLGAARSLTGRTGALQRPDGSPIASEAIESAEELASMMADLLSTEAGLVSVMEAYADTVGNLEGREDSQGRTPSMRAPNADVEALAGKISIDGTALDVLVLLRSALQVERDLRLQQSDGDAATLAEAMGEALYGTLGLLASAIEFKR